MMKSSATSARRKAEVIIFSFLRDAVKESGSGFTNAGFRSSGRLPPRF
jgi:hypothetical protein